jgi:hypothetical protein
VTRNRVAIICTVLAVLLLGAGYLMVTAWVLGGDDETISGHVVSVEPAGSLSRVCVADSRRTLCGEIAPAKATTGSGSLAAGDCVRMKVARGAALSVDGQSCP